MRLENYLNEKYIGSFEDPYSRDYIEFFVNPSRSEFTDAMQQSKKQRGFVRFFAFQKNKKVYIWNSEVIHVNAFGQIKKNDPSLKGVSSVSNNILPGVAKPGAGGWRMTSSDELRSEPVMAKKVVKQDWSWVDNYIKVTPWIERARKKLKISPLALT